MTPAMHARSTDQQRTWIELTKLQTCQGDHRENRGDQPESQDDLMLAPSTEMKVVMDG